MKAIILAAGAGERIRNGGSSLPKPLVRLGGLALLERAVLSASKAGISEFIIVVGCKSDEIIFNLENRPAFSQVHWVFNRMWEAGNGSSVLEAKHHISNEPFLVLMADHLLFPSTISGLIQHPYHNSQTIMAVDRKMDGIVDIDDATKVKLNGDKIVKVGKKLTSYDALYVGAAVCSPDFFVALEQVSVNNMGTLSHNQGMNLLASKGLLEYHDIGDDRWEDIDTIESLKNAEKILYQSLRKPTDGFISRHLERNLSLRFTRLIINTGIKPNHITIFLVLLGALSGFLFSLQGYWSKVFGALVFWATSFLDGCDGEIARLKYMESRLGGWLDLWGDNLVHAMVFMGMGIGLYRDTGDPDWIGVGSLAVLGVLLSVSWVSWSILKEKKKKGPIYTSVVDESRMRHAPAWFSNFVKLANAMSRRDFIFGVIFITLLCWLDNFLWVACIGSNLYFLILVIITTVSKNLHA